MINESAEANHEPVPAPIPLLWEAVLPLLAARRREQRQPIAGGPERVGHSYRWPDGSWTHSG
jgi:hypothetical protein